LWISKKNSPLPKTEMNPNLHSAIRILHSALEREIVDFEEELAGAKN
jgi:hypothetical protein